MISRRSIYGLLVLAASLAAGPVRADEPIPRGQTRPPGPPLSPAEAIAKMQVPPGFEVELVACEPDIVNPVAMTFDERGRVWITESLEYPRFEPGPGRDRIKVLEDTDGDGRADKFTVFADGLNIPSGIAVGYGGVWVANAPDLLLLRDTDGDGRADQREVIVTGFGRADTHELPNSLTWGPDGWLYGLNGVFNHSRIQHRGQTHEFTCAVFRIHPRTREFQLFAEGTSNPWGIAWDPQGNMFLSACVIDHLWHITESGYYHRQGGPYPPFTWKIDAFPQDKHQMAAYCGIHYLDSDAYPVEYRDRLVMGNIHGNCLNVDVVQPNGATFRSQAADDFLTANDVWFMPVVQKTGPDGCLYVLDWYDRYHCYQDARRDPEGVDRGHGRLYRIRYQDTPRARPFDLASETDDQLIERLHSANVFYRDLAQRLLAERNSADARGKLQRLVLAEPTQPKVRLHALWALLGADRLNDDFHQQLFAHSDPTVRAWAVRAAGNQREVSAAVREKVVAAAADDPTVQVQVAVAATKIQDLDPLPLLIAVLQHCGDDPLIPHIVWQNLHPQLETESDRFVKLAGPRLKDSPNLARLMPRVLDRITSQNKPADKP